MSERPKNALDRYIEERDEWDPGFAEAVQRRVEELKEEMRNDDEG